MDPAEPQRDRVEVRVVKSLTQVAANANAVEHSEPASSREFLERQAFEAFKAFVLAVQNIIRTSEAGATPVLESRAIDGDPSSDVMTATRRQRSSASTATRCTTLPVAA